MPWFLTPHGPHFVVEPGTVDEYERRDYVEMTAQQVTDYYAGVAFPDPPSFATEAEVPGIVASAVTAGTGPVSDALRAAFDARYVLPTSAGREALATADSAAMLSWHAALANRDNALALVVVMGDSNGEGQGATAKANRWVDRLQTALRTRFPTTGIGTGGGAGVLPPYFQATSIGQPSVVAGSPSKTHAVAGDFGIGKRAYTIDTTDTLTYTVTGTSIDVDVAKTVGGGILGVQIDGGVVNQIDTNATGTNDGYFTRYSLGASGSHTVVISAVSGASIFGGLMVYDGDESKGVQVLDFSRYGSTAGTYSLWSSYWGRLLAQFSPTPSLFLIPLGTNDWNAGNTPAAYSGYLTTIISTIKTRVASPLPSIVLMPHVERSDIATGNWQEYVDVCYDLAAADPTNVSVLDLSRRLPEVAGDTRGLFADAVHLNNKGHAFVADAVTRAISPR